MIWPDIAGEHHRAKLLEEAANERLARAARPAGKRRQLQRTFRQGTNAQGRLARATRVALALAIGARVACGLVSPGSVAGQSELTVALRPAPTGGRAYTAILTPAGDARTRVELTIDQILRDEHTPAGEFQAQVAVGTCDAPEAAGALSLSPVREGYSVTELPVAIPELTASPHVIAVEREAGDTRSGFLACGAIATAGQPPSPTTAPVPSPPPSAAQPAVDARILVAGGILVAALVVGTLLFARGGRNYW